MRNAKAPANYALSCSGVTGRQMNLPKKFVCIVRGRQAGSTSATL